MNPARVKTSVVLLALSVLFIDALVPLGVACGILYTAVVLVAQFQRDPGYLRRVALACSVLTVVGYFVSPVGDAVPWMVIANRVLSIYTIWLTALMALKINRLHSEEVKSLSGLLPICAWCKQVRNDKGYWTQVDAYLQQHTELDLSHSICPDCYVAQLREDQLHRPVEPGPPH